MGLESLTPSPAAGFDMPLALLTACHQRILHFCSMLERLAEHIEKYDLDLQATETAKLIYKYFSTAGRHHHEDEENDLFPLLLQHNNGLAILLNQLTETHRQLDNIWEELQPLLLDSELITGNIDKFKAISHRFAELNREHIMIENRELLPQAAVLLTNTENTSLGRMMARRRGIPYS